MGLVQVYPPMVAESDPQVSKSKEETTGFSFSWRVSVPFMCEFLLVFILCLFVSVFHFLCVLVINCFILSVFSKQVVYLDFLEPGPYRQVPHTLPRIRVWKGDMIKDYSELDRIQRHVYGKRPVSFFTAHVLFCC